MVISTCRCNDAFRLYCSVCQLNPATAGILCVDCRTDLTLHEGSPVMAPEQVSGRVANPTRAALVDYWGRAHLLDPNATIGRDLGDDSGLAIHEPSVSRHHAKLALDNHTWTVCDLGSSNGTFVEDGRVEGAVVVHPRDRIRFGQVGFYFLEHVDFIPSDIVEIDTVRPGAAITQPLLKVIEPAVRQCEIQLSEPTGGGGGIVQIDGKQVQLTLAQLELVSILLARMESDTDRAREVRGFVSVSELLGKISLEASLPRDAHVRQLIRRVRRVFIKADLGDLIESRYGLGYRILVINRQGT